MYSALSTHMYYNHSTCTYYDHSTCTYYDHSTCMYYDHSTCTYYDHSTCMYYDDRTCMYHDHNACMYYDHTTCVHFDQIACFTHRAHARWNWGRGARGWSPPGWARRFGAPIGLGGWWEGGTVNGFRGGDITSVDGQGWVDVGSTNCRQRFNRSATCCGLVRVVYGMDLHASNKTNWHTLTTWQRPKKACDRKCAWLAPKRLFSTTNSRASCSQLCWHVCLDDNVFRIVNRSCKYWIHTFFVSLKFESWITSGALSRETPFGRLITIVVASSFAAKNTWTHEHMSTSAHEHMNTLTHEHMNTWTHEHLNTWTH